MDEERYKLEIKNLRENIKKLQIEKKRPKKDIQN